MIARYGLTLYPSLEHAGALGFEKVGDNAEGFLLRKRTAKGWQYAFVLYPHLNETYK